MQHKQSLHGFHSPLSVLHEIRRLKHCFSRPVFRSEGFCYIRRAYLADS